MKPTGRIIWLIVAVFLFLIVTAGLVQPQSYETSYDTSRQHGDPHQLTSPEQQPGKSSQPEATDNSFQDALGHFRINLPQGVIPTGATYNFTMPSAMCQISIMTFAQDEMFQIQKQGFSDTMRQMGASIDTDQPKDIRGIPGRMITVTLRNQGSGMSLRSINIFIPVKNIWVQVNGSAENQLQLNEIVETVLSGLAY